MKTVLIARRGGGSADHNGVVDFVPMVTENVLGATLVASGQLSKATMTNVVLHAAMLADLALAERLIDTSDSLDIDTTPTGFEPIDRLLKAIDADPTRPLPWWISYAPISATDVAAELVRDGRWQHKQLWLREPRYQPMNVLGRATFVSALDQDQCDVEVTVSACLLAAAGWLARAGFVPSGSLIARCGPAHWLVGDLAAALSAKHAMVKLSDNFARSQMMISNGGW